MKYFNIDKNFGYAHENVICSLKFAKARKQKYNCFLSKKSDQKI